MSEKNGLDRVIKFLKTHLTLVTVGCSLTKYFLILLKTFALNSPLNSNPAEPSTGLPLIKGDLRGNSTDHREKSMAAEDFLGLLTDLLLMCRFLKKWGFVG